MKCARCDEETFVSDLAGASSSARTEVAGMRMDRSIVMQRQSEKFKRRIMTFDMSETDEPLCSKCVELIVREWIVKKRHFEQLKTS